MRSHLSDESRFQYFQNLGGDYIVDLRGGAVEGALIVPPCCVDEVDAGGDLTEDRRIAPE